MGKPQGAGAGAFGQRSGIGIEPQHGSELLAGRILVEGRGAARFSGLAREVFLDQLRRGADDEGHAMGGPAQASLSTAERWKRRPP